MGSGPLTDGSALCTTSSGKNPMIGDKAMGHRLAATRDTGVANENRPFHAPTNWRSARIHVVGVGSPCLTSEVLGFPNVGPTVHSTSADRCFASHRPPRS